MHTHDGREHSTARPVAAASEAIAREVSPGLVEAMAAGLPIVATRSGGIPDVVQDGETGLLVPERDVSALAGGTARLMDDPSLAARLAAGGRRALRERFAPERIAQGFDAVYRQAVAAR